MPSPIISLWREFRALLIAWLYGAFIRNKPLSSNESSSGNASPTFDEPFNQDEPFRILDLPLDVVRMIFDELSICDHFLLSRTCQTMRSLLAPSLMQLDRVEFYTAISDAFPNKLYCLHCANIHSIVLSDVTYPPGKFGKCRRIKEPKDNVLKLGIHYDLAHHHVRFAVKTANAGNSQHPYYVKPMAPYSITYPGTGPQQIKFLARPKIISKRFLIFTAHLFGDGAQPLPLSAIKPFKICPHLAYDRSSLSLPKVDSLVGVIQRAFNEPDVMFQGACPCCPTDYGLSLLEGCLVVEAWKDFGHGGCSSDLEWLSHFFDQPGHDQSHRTYVPHVPGSIRNLYLM